MERGQFDLRLSKMRLSSLDCIVDEEDWLGKEERGSEREQLDLHLRKMRYSSRDWREAGPFEDRVGWLILT